MLKIDAGVGLGPGMPPRGDMMAGRIEEGAEPHLAFAAHFLSSVSSRIRLRVAPAWGANGGKL